MNNKDERNEQWCLHCKARPWPGVVVLVVQVVHRLVHGLDVAEAMHPVKVPCTASFKVASYKTASYRVGANKVATPYDSYTISFSRFRIFYEETSNRHSFSEQPTFIY